MFVLVCGLKWIYWLSMWRIISVCGKDCEMVLCKWLLWIMCFIFLMRRWSFILYVCWECLLLKIYLFWCWMKLIKVGLIWCVLLIGCVMFLFGFGILLIRGEFRKGMMLILCWLIWREFILFMMNCRRWNVGGVYGLVWVWLESWFVFGCEDGRCIGWMVWVSWKRFGLLLSCLVRRFDLIICVVVIGWFLYGNRMFFVGFLIELRLVDFVGVCVRWDWDFCFCVF